MKNQIILTFFFTLTISVFSQTESKQSIKPQEPTEPFSYYSEEVTFKNKDANITLAGTITLPKKNGNFPVVVLISGSGPQDRNEALMGHKPFLVLSDYLTKKGIAVLRYDDRGTASSQGDFKSATTNDFATDVEAAVEYLLTRKEINTSKIGLIGHSEGGIIAPIVASRSSNIDFIVLLAGTAIRGDILLLAQQKYVMESLSYPPKYIENLSNINKGAYEIVLKNENDAVFKEEITNYYKNVLEKNPGLAISALKSKEEYIDFSVSQLTSAWMNNLLKYDPTDALKEVKCPVLAVNGEKDIQVPSQMNLSVIETSLKQAGNNNVTIIEFPGLNHLFQSCTYCTVDEYARLDETFSPFALSEITNWILKQVN